jgi:signal transduction histidine kinase
VRELEEANAAKTLFLGTVSHELRTPLAALVGATELMAEAEMGPEARHYVEMMQRSGQRLVQLVQDMLEFSCLEAHRTALRPTPFDVREVLASVEEWAGPLAASRGLTITFGVDDAVPATVVGDGVRVAQVVTNLVQNALKFTESGGVDVRVAGHGTGACGEAWVEFTVADTGVGIPADRVHALFEPFTKAERCPSRERHGPGLGLAICRDLVDLMEGRLQASSEVGQGSTFTFGVPLGLPARSDV